ncbi:MAG: hypothetical protein PHW52_01805 [Candidatus Pacebacteria bacterium]|nr:hypothetical protein [Candidatus Paceibacterota bacterium]
MIRKEEKIILPVVRISFEAMQRLCMYIRYCQEEVSGLGRVSMVGNNFVIHDVYLLEQKVSATNTVLSPKDLSNFLVKMVTDGDDPEGIKLWWHSHVDMPVFWSNIDEHTAGSFRNKWMLSLVGNKAEEFRIRLDIFDPFRLTIDGLELKIDFSDDLIMTEDVKKEISEKVSSVNPFPVFFDFDVAQALVDHRLRLSQRRKK